jgi:hypothetical protein
MDKGRLEVDDWKVEARALTVPAKGSSRFRVPTSVIGVVVSLIVHLLLLPSVYWGTQSRPGVESSPRGAPNEQKSISERLEVVYLAPSARARDQLREAWFAPAMNVKTLLKIRADPPAPVDLESLALDDNAATVSEASQVEDGRLFSLYIGQIQARIERIWRRPRTPVSEQIAQLSTVSVTFLCQVQVVQDLGGNVQEVLLPDCNGTSAWQRSLLVAIRQASPLPAPPDPKIFATSLVLHFIGLPYTSGDSDEYERPLPGAFAKGH